ncbi:phosphomannomutase [Haloarchaeobius sp. TZWWS8]|uniref:phosphomannomutase n=1 Tax=Haloarchaeobius sp. TZWWS8 TaxID=3446121 RepID=UPI003EBEE744
MTLFGTAGIRGPVDEVVTPETALEVGRAVGRDGDEFVVGRDGRETGPALAAAMEAGLESSGADVYRVGMLPTPALAYASQGRRGVMLTASHNPPMDNGIKVFDDGVEYARDAEERVEDRIRKQEPPAPWGQWGDGFREAVLGDYQAAVADYTRGLGDEDGTEVDEEKPLTGVRVVVDCGTGMASLATPQVLRMLGADVVALNANVDGHFPARESKPTAETLTDLIAFLGRSDFDIGLAHDGDSDRIVVVTGDGEVVHEDTVLAILAEYYVRGSDAADPVVVTTPNASARIDERVAAGGGRVERVRLGALHEGIARETAAGTDDTEIVFAAEPWKHIHTAFGGWIDGVVSAAVLTRLVAERGSVAALRAPVSERPYRKVSVECPDSAKSETMATLATTLPETFPDGDVDTDYGVRVDMPDGSWVLVRPSGTEPYVRVYAESEDVEQLVETAVATVKQAVADAR